jgi:hypothetical protein
MHPIRKLRESGHATPDQFATLLDGHVVMLRTLANKS